MSLLTKINLQTCGMECKHSLSSIPCDRSISKQVLPGVATATEMRVLAFLLSSCFSLSAAFYFHVGEREEKCIIEDIPSDTLITGTFKIQQWDMGRQDFLESAPGLGLFVTVTTYNEEVLLSKLYGPQGTFYFTSHSPGEHIICLESNSTQLVSFGGSKLDREENFRMTSEDTNSNVLWWAFAQTLIFISVGIFQMKYLKDFFIAKKLV
ncbi:transmembrane emp24 domain-containing protein 11 isoform X2 [Myotis daubentonii]|uniref:transmembrane emp24 domain-containing protein 11 isoform X2 n=1 Tax=Myotis daubentonii TaxID=98922 RepID=UPI00287368DA|nr:transmembrane emp24 domain-containing protein 11 isoform X2 [Myotis daubentonii]